MLKIMENEVEIFRAWLKKYVKDDKHIKGNELAKKINLPSARITHYHSGRVDNGLRTFPNIPFKIRQAILKVTGVSSKQMKATGRQQLSPQTETTHLSQATVQAMIDASLNSQPTDLERHLANKHQQLLSQFNDKEQAHSINQKLIEIEKVAPDYLAELNDILAVKLNHLQKPKKQDVK